VPDYGMREHVVGVQY